MTPFQSTFAFAMPGGFELMIIGAIILLLFGHRLPKMMRSLGQGITEFKKGVNDIQDDVNSASEEKVEEKSDEQSEDKPEGKSGDEG